MKFAHQKSPSLSPPEIPFTVFSRNQRAAILALVSFAGMISPLSSLMYTPALPTISKALGVSVSDVNLTITTYLVFQGITPPIWGSIGDVYGRRLLYIITLAITLGSSAGLCFTNSFTVVLILRALHATGCSSTRALGAGVIRDIVPPSSRGGYMGMYSATVGVGTAFGPVVGGILAQYTSWHGIFYFLLALTIVSLAFILLLLPETLHAVVGNGSTLPPTYLRPPIAWLCPTVTSHGSDEPKKHYQLPSRQKLDFFGPIRIMKYPDVLCSLLFTGICYTVWQDSMVATSTIYATQYKLDEAEIGLTYISNGVGSLIGNVVIGKILDRDYRLQLKWENAGNAVSRRRVVMIEVARMRSLRYNAPLFMACILIFGWIVQLHTHISVSIIVAFFIGWLDSSILTTYSTLMVDLFEEAASMSSASINLVRCLLGAVGSSTIALMIKTMGVGWSFTTLAGICAMAFPLVWYQYHYGSKFRTQRNQACQIEGPEESLPESKSLSSVVSSDRSLTFDSSPASFPLDFSPSSSDAVRSQRGSLDLLVANEKIVSALLNMFCSSSDVPLCQVLVAAFCATIFRITGQDNGVLAFSVGESEQVKPLHYVIENEVVPTNFIHNVLDSLSHKDSNITTEIISCLVLFSFGLQQSEIHKANPGLHCDWHLVQDGQTIRARIGFCRDLFSEASVRMFSGVFARVLVGFTTNPSTSVARLPLCLPTDLEDILKWNDTYKEPLEFLSVGDMFRDSARQTPNSLAVVNGDHSLLLTYRQLDQWSDALALWLCSQGCGGEKETVIGVWQTRSALLVVTYLACLKAGCAYMPIEMTLPHERVRTMLLESDSPLVFGNGSSHEFPCKDMVRYFDLSSPEMDDVLRNDSPSAALHLPHVKPNRLSSVIFTSGSTGVPKAVMIQHSCLLNFILSDFKPIQRGDRTAMMLNIAFDVSSGEIWYPLRRGATLVCHMQSPNAPFDVDNLSAFLEKEQITSLHAPPAIIKALVDANFFENPLPALRSVAMGGEAALLEFLRPILRTKPNLILSNNYGPSESTIDAITFQIPSNYCRERIPIGRPMANIGAYVVDGALQPVPQGVCGELLLAGKGLAREYLNRPSLTAEKFVHLNHDHPLGPLRVYCTGDLVRQTVTGELEFIRRKEDGQVKLRGQRIELGEVEQAIKRHHNVNLALVVLCRRGRDDDRLIAYYTTHPGTIMKGLTEALRSKLHALLPTYMIPSALLHLPSFPLTLTGKVNRRLMASPDFVDQVIKVSSNATQRKLQAPRSEEEMIILNIFAQVLDTPADTIDIDDNLFEIGGHSMIVTRIIFAIRRHFSVAFEISLFMDNATVAGVAAILSNCKSEDKDFLTHITRLQTSETVFPASDAQTRLWVEEEMNPGLARYNAGFQRKVMGYLDVSALENAFIALVDRHEALRTIFFMKGSNLMQRIEPSNHATVQIINQAETEEWTEKQARDFLFEQRSRPFNLSEDIPVRFAIVKTSADVHFVSAVIHHIATDGWSSGIIDQELTILYNAFSVGKKPELRLLPLRYCDYSVWQRNRVEAGILESQLEYWKKQLDGSRPLELHADYVRPEKLSGRASEMSFSIGKTSVAALRRLAAVHHTSLYVVLLAAFRATLYRITGESDGAIGMVNANRPQTELEGIVGFFVNTHAIRLFVDSQSSFEDLILQARSVTTDALQHSEVPFDKVVAHLAPQRELSRNALVQLSKIITIHTQISIDPGVSVFVLQDFAHIVSNEAGKGLRGLVSEDIRNASIRLDMSIHLFVQGDALRCYIMYQSDLFSSASIQTFTDVFQRVINVVTEFPSFCISRLKLWIAMDLDKLARWNNTQKLARPPASIGDRFREVVAAKGSSLAVVDGSMSLSYRELDEQTDRLAAWLVGRGSNIEEIVGLWMGRSALLVIAYLGCLKAGLAYMPLDKTMPTDRLRLMVQSAKCRLILASGECPLGDEISSIDLAQHYEIILSTPRVELPAVSDRHLSNVMFTSGSTGVPKGVMVEHRGMVNLCAPETTDWPGELRNGLTTSIGFDPSGFQIFTTLLGGSQLHCLADNGFFDLNEYQNFIINSGIQRCSMTPSILSSLLETGNDWLEKSSLRHIMLGGEKLEPSKITECLRRVPHLEISSSYGPAEASVRSAYFAISSNNHEEDLRQIPIGRALPNTSMYVLDETLNPVPAGVLGEIAVSGIHLARGYMNQPSLTLERFVQTPENSPFGARRLYRTGDLGYWTSDGLVQFVGRIDSQLKLRGRRIEAGEVETILHRHPAVKSSAAVTVEAQSGQQLVAYVQLRADTMSKNEDVLALWEQRYNEEGSYGVLEDDAAGHDFARWVSMYTGEPIPVDQMQQWLDDTIEHVAPTSGDRVLEIGVGTGMIALNVIDQVTSYVGTDVSALALEFLDAQIKRKNLSSKMSLIRAAAHQVDSFPKANFSLVILNSVVQYFPSADYFTEVIGNILDVMDQSGRIFIGDVRSYSLIQSHDMERALAALELDSSLDDIRYTLNRYAEVQAELLLDPTFFFELRRRFPTIVHVEIKPKLMQSRNELSRYRYTVILHVRTRPELITPCNWIDCRSLGYSASDLRSQLRQSPEPTIGALNIPIPDIEEVHHILSRVEGDMSCDSVPILHMLGSSISNFSAPAFLKQMAVEEGWDVILDYSLQGRSRNCFHAIFIRSKTNVGLASRQIGDFPSPESSGPSYNILASKQVDIAAILRSIEGHVRMSLPPYMVPSRVIRVDELPLNRSGKLDRRLLASRDYLEAHDEVTRFQTTSGPITDTERDVLAIFSRALNREPDMIDIHESLFNLGGHSLTATLVVSAVRREMGAELSMASFFRHPTVKDVAATIRSHIPFTSISRTETSNTNDLPLASVTIRANPEMRGPTLFMFPESTGFASVYSPAFETIEFPVVAFGDKHWGRPYDGDSIQSIAASLSKEIFEIQPDGPYFLLGWSLGGYLALETAIQLEAAGGSVAIVLMFDSSVYDRPLGAASWRSEFDHLLTVVNDKATWLAQFTRANTMISNYKMSQEHYTGKVVLVKALRARSGDVYVAPPDPFNGWRVALPQVEVRGFDSSHRTMFDRENGAKMGALISQIIKEGFA